MAATYSEEEIDLLLYMKKRFLDEAWKERKAGRATTGESSVVMKALAENGDPKFEFEVETRTNEKRDTISITLLGRIRPRPMEPLVRYDIQDNDHRNPPWFKPLEIEGGTFHRHRTNARAFEERGCWDACAEPIPDLPALGSPKQQLDRLRGRFLTDLNLTFTETETHLGFFGKDGG